MATKTKELDDWQDVPLEAADKGLDDWQDVPTQNESGAWDNTKDFLAGTVQNAVDMIPGKGMIDKVGQVSYASQQKIADLFRDDKDKKSFGSYYDQARELEQGRQAKDRERGGLPAKVLGGASGAVLGGGFIPSIGGSGLIPAVSRIGANAGISAVDAGTRGKDLWNTGEAIDAATLSGGISAGIESLPVVGKGTAWLGKKAGSALFGVGEEATDRYLSNPEKMRKVIKDGSDGLRAIKDRVDEAYYNRVTKIREDASAGLIEANQAAKEAKKAAEEYTAALKNIRPSEHLTDDVISGIKNERSKLSDFSSKAFDTLDGTSFNRDEVLAELERIKSKMLVDGQKPKMGDAVGGYNIIEKLQSAIASRNKPETDSLMNIIHEAPGLEGSDLKKFIQQLDQESSAKAYSQFGGTGNDEYIKGIRRPLDSMLKTKVDAYKQAMLLTSEQAELVKNLTDVFGDSEKARKALLLASDPEKGGKVLNYVKILDKNNGTKIAEGLEEYLNAQKLLKDPEAVLMKKAILTGDSERELQAAKKAANEAGKLRQEFSRVAPGSSESTIERVGRGKNFEAEKQLQKLMGEQGLEDVKDYALGRDFVTDKTRGARRTAAGAIIGGTIGSLLGGPVGGAIGTTAGTAAGATIDRMGGAIWQSILDGTLKVGPYKKILEDAAKVSPSRVAAVHYVLMKNYPDYKNAVESSNK